MCRKEECFSHGAMAGTTDGTTNRKGTDHTIGTGNFFNVTRGEIDMKKTLMYGTLAAMVITGVTSAIACDKGKDGHNHGAKMFEKLDTDSDGIITKAEFIAKTERKFAKMDADSDGKVTKEEVEKHRALMKEKHKEKNKEENEEKSKE